MLHELEVVACSCTECQSMCQTRPCWGTPADIKKLIEAGFADKLMSDYWAGGFVDSPVQGDVVIIGPAIVGHEGGSSPWWPHGRCTFLTEDNLCPFHDKDMKPLEGRLATCEEDHENHKVNVHELVARTWATKEGQEVVEMWERIVE